MPRRSVSSTKVMKDTTYDVNSEKTPTKNRQLICKSKKMPLPLHLLKYVGMISKNKVKLIRSLEHKKYRKELGLFVAEGPKVVGDLLCAGQLPKMLVATPEGIDMMEKRGIDCTKVQETGTEYIMVTAGELRKMSFLQHPQEVLGVFPLPCKGQDAVMTEDSMKIKGLVLALDGVQDPGNLGTIIRIADWFGIETIYCSPDTADAYNPKVVQATMGSISRVHIMYTDLTALIDKQPESMPVYGTLLDGENMYEANLSAEGIIVMGNEGNGLTDAVRQRLTHRLLIPSYPPDSPTAESLNVAVATAIVCAEFRRLRV